MPRPRLSLHGKDTSTVFSLLGLKENDLTAALGWTLRNSPRLLAALTGDLSPAPVQPTMRIDLEVADDLGRTDLELVGNDHRIVVEVKRGWRLPTVDQLAAYAPRLHGVPVAHLLTLSDCSAEWADLQLPSSVEGVHVSHVPWSRVQQQLARSRQNSSGHERLWLDQLIAYLKEALRMTKVSDSEVFCVVLSNERPAGGGPHTFREIVDQGLYYFPYGWGRGWPPVPPNFIAFRWSNQVHRVHRVLAHEVIPSLQDRWPDIPDADDTSGPHMLCTLGPPLRMQPLPTGINYRSAHLWVLLDQLFTSATLQEALQNSRSLREGTRVDLRA